TPHANPLLVSLRLFHAGVIIGQDHGLGPTAEHVANPAVLVAHLDGPPVGSQDGFRERFPCLRHPSALAHSLPSRWTVRSSNSRTSARRTHPRPGRPGSAVRQQL